MVHQSGYRMRRQQGFTYLVLIILVTIIGLVAVSSLQVGALAQRREKEQLLLDIGLEFHHALLSYAASTPAGQSTMPQTIADLLRDPRYPGFKRHLRKLFVDPLTGTNEWGTVNGVDGAKTGIIAVYSLSEAKPIKIADFDLPFRQFAGKKTYREWLFVAQASEDPAAAPIVPPGPLVPPDPNKPNVPIPSRAPPVRPRT